jgi:hypothetical protein
MGPYHLTDVLDTMGVHDALKFPDVNPFVDHSQGG